MQGSSGTDLEEDRSTESTGIGTARKRRIS